MASVDLERLKDHWDPRSVYFPSNYNKDYTGWGDIRNKILILWTEAHAHSAGGDPLKTLASLPKSSRRDEMILAIAGEAYSKMTSRDVLGILQLVSDGQKTYEAIPAEGWKRLDRAAVESLLKLWKGDEPTAQLVLKQWMKANQ